MSKAVEITKLTATPGELRRLAAKTKDGEVVRRLLAIAMVLEGRPREEAAKTNGMQRQTLRDWVHRYNGDGVAGLASQVGGGRPPSLSEQQLSEIKALVVQGPDPETDGVVRWRCVDVREQILRRYSVVLHEPTAMVRRLGACRLGGRPPPRASSSQRDQGRWWFRDRTRRQMGLCAGAVSMCANISCGAIQSSCMNGPLESCCAGSA